MNIAQRTQLFIKKIKGTIFKKNNVYNISTESLRNSFNENLVTLNKGDKVRIAFLFQIASFWPNWESFYLECLNDNNITCCLYLLTDEIKEHSQILSAKKFLQENHIDFVEYTEESYEKFNPHIVVLQTPYDYDHRYPNHQAAYYMAHGHSCKSQ